MPRNGSIPSSWKVPPESNAPTLNGEGWGSSRLLPYGHKPPLTYHHDDAIITLLDDDTNARRERWSRLTATWRATLWVSLPRRLTRLSMALPGMASAIGQARPSPLVATPSLTCLSSSYRPTFRSLPPRWTRRIWSFFGHSLALSRWRSAAAKSTWSTSRRARHSRRPRPNASARSMNSTIARKRTRKRGRGGRGRGRQHGYNHRPALPGPARPAPSVQR
jgi:hypothetical protein